MAFDENKYKQLFEQRYGSGSFDAGLSDARKIGQLKAQAEIAKQQYNQRVKESKKKSYADAQSVFENSVYNEEVEKQLDDMIKNPKKNGAARNAENIRNDPALQQAIKNRGLKVNEFINAMYNAASGGQFRSEREYKGFASELTKKNKKEKKEKGLDILSKYNINASVDSASTGKKKDEKKPGLLTDIKDISKLAIQAFNPFDDVSMSEVVDKYFNREQSKGFKELARGSNRAVDSASFGLLSNLDKKVNDRDPYYTSKREFGEGGGTDLLTSGLGYLVPGVGAYKALNATKAGKVLTEFGAKGVKQRLASEAAKGAITGGGLAGAEVGVREGLNPDDYSTKDNLLHLGIGLGAGAIADPAIYGLGKLAQSGLSKYAKGTVPSFSGKPSQSVVESLTPSNANRLGNQYDDFFNRIAPLQNGRSNNLKVEIPENERAFYQTQSRINQLAPEVEGYNQEFREAVEQQYQYLKNSMGKGVQSGGVVKDADGYVTSAYGRVSNNPKWYQDFYSQNGRRPTNQELRELAEQHVREGFEDEVGSLPAWAPKAVQEIDDQLDELTTLLRQDPSQEPAIRPILEALEQDRKGILQSIDNTRSEYANLSQQIKPQQEIAPTVEPSLNRLRSESLRPGRDYEPIEPLSNARSGGLVRVPEVDRTPIDIPNAKEIVKRQISMDGKREKSKWSFDKAMTALVDDLRPLDKATRQLGGKDLAFDKNPYTQARLARGVAGKAETYLRGGIYNEQGQKVGKGLEEIIKPIEKKMDDFIAYATSKRALDYDEKSLIAGIKPKDVEGMSDRQLADAAIRQMEAESPEFKQIHQELVGYNNRLMDELVDAGVLDKDIVLSLREENPNYIPMFRVQDKKVRGFEPLTNPKRTYANLGEPIKKRTGSEREIINPIESIIKNTYLTLNMAERNRVGSSLLELVEGAGENAWGRVVTKGKGLSMDDIGKSLDEANTQLNDGASDAIDNLFKGEGNKVYVYKDGQKVEMELQEDLYKSMLSLDAQKQNFFIKMLAVPTRTLRTGAVLSPDFGPVNIFRDQFSAYINSKYGFKPFVDMFSGLANVLKKDDVYWSWKNNGGANSVLSTLDREYLQQDLRRMVKQSLASNVKDKAKHPLRTVLEPLRKVSEITEEATRLGEFKKGLKKGASPREAAYSSRDLIDFNRAGTRGRQYNQVTAFFNAAVQSVDKLARTFKENPKGATVRALTGITLPSVVAYMYSHDKEWYKEIPQRDRDLFWHFEIDDQIYKLPKPFEAGVMFGTVAERILDALKTEDPEAFDGLGKTLVEAFTPSWIPTAVAPWIEVYGNKSIYFDSPIVPRREQDLLPEDQYGPYQSELSKGFGKLMNKSPRKVEHVFKGYTGGLGKYFLQLSDMGAEMAGKERPDMPDRGMADMPIVNRFVVKNLEGNNQSVNDFYKRMDALKRENLSAKRHNPDLENSEAYTDINKISKEISKLQADKRAIIEAKGVDGKEKAKVIKQIDAVITQLARAGKQIQ